MVLSRMLVCDLPPTPLSMARLHGASALSGPGSQARIADDSHPHDSDSRGSDAEGSLQVHQDTSYELETVLW